MKKFKYGLPPFLAFIDLSPDQFIELRKEQVETGNTWVEDKLLEFKKLMVGLEYSKHSTASRIGEVAGFLTNTSNKLTIDVPKSFWKLEETGETKASRKRKNPPSNPEMRKVIKVADRRQRIAMLLGYQAGLAPTDIVKLSWTNLIPSEEAFMEIVNKPTYEQFSYIEHERNKSDEEGIIIFSPDLLVAIYAEWIDQGKPLGSTRILNYRGEPIQGKHCNLWFKECSLKALGKKRTDEITFYNLRDAFNNIIKTTPELKQETADRLMGHAIKGSRGAYFVTPDYSVQVYKEQVFPRLTINGWKYEKQSVEMGQIMEEVDNKLADHVITINKQQETIEALKIAVEQSKNRDKMRIEQIQDIMGDNEKIQNNYDSLVKMLTDKGIITTNSPAQRKAERKAKDQLRKASQ